MRPALFLLSLLAYADSRLVSIGDRSLSIDCTGNPSKSTVILLAGGGRTAADWSKTQPSISTFTRVCSYDRAGLGQSDKPATPQTTAEIVTDLHALLKAAGEKPPYVLAGHSIAGIYARRFSDAFPNEVAAFLFVDSSHEEQFLRLHEVDPTGPNPGDLGGAFLVKPGQRLDWHTDHAVIVLAQGKTTPQPNLSAETNAAFARIWNDLQHDLAKRSPQGQYRLAEQSGHFVHIDQPDLVIQALRELSAN
ncbi:MAG TPA: alpha/beta hydrolase [Bryobacteraceae bacterium]|jgi:pimeloyl-ACP methyl ester carboxylesterase|nr:alpha/beta hydrolase [Bryobacteraceae bacterium]